MVSILGKDETERERETRKRVREREGVGERERGAEAGRRERERAREMKLRHGRIYCPENSILLSDSKSPVPPASENLFSTF